MTSYIITEAHLSHYASHLQREERSAGTIEGYLRHLRAFADWLGGRPATKDLVGQWKQHLLASGYAPVTVNNILAALHGFFRLQGWNDCRVHYLRIQRRVFRDPARELQRDEYQQLVTNAYSLGQERLALAMETLAATGIRVSELAAITVEAARKGSANIHLKGKIRTILLPAKLVRKLLDYARRQHLKSGPIFRTASGRPLSRRQLWREMKALARQTGVPLTKVFPHNLRHLFATIFYSACRDIVRLADVLGHVSIETTRLYLQTSGSEHQRQLDQLALVS